MPLIPDLGSLEKCVGRTGAESVAGPRTHLRRSSHRQHLRVASRTCNGGKSIRRPKASRSRPILVRNPNPERDKSPRIANISQSLRCKRSGRRLLRRVTDIRTRPGGRISDQREPHVQHK
ncbi:hypothetical protein GWI33_013154 [Rhynchophorus ferrugineus]|uniref:Uncharacterized protein n=1 Tax=Rhynchophorus ferrugineus TaxID=354439 RepID=A0A834IHI5_RHYFE|nr:hypothetical protein GWI33_013154 [Rhynchophorus ferrugineus]